jgi:G3E family GTPase
LKQIDKISVTIISGFLGSGKTTFLNQILLQYPNKKIAVIENEFGSLNIDRDLIVGVKGNIYELSNGCICCTLNDDLIATLESIKLLSKDIEHLVIETTGIADTGIVVAPFLTQQNLSDTFKIDAIITVVDACNFITQLDKFAEVEKQVAFADYIVINKVDLISPIAKSRLYQKIITINHHAKLYDSNYGKVDNEDVLSLNLFEKNNIATATQHPKSTLTWSLNKSQLSNHNDIVSYSYIFAEALDFEKFSNWIKLLIPESYLLEKK